MTEEMSAEQFREVQKGSGKRKRRGKYNASRIERHGITFDSISEADRYEFLLTLQAGGAIQDLEPHPRIDYIGHRGRVLRYTGDARYVIPDSGEVVIEDVKPQNLKRKQEAFVMRCRLVFDQEGIIVTMVKRDGRGGWIMEPAFAPTKAQLLMIHNGRD